MKQILRTLLENGCKVIDFPHGGGEEVARTAAAELGIQDKFFWTTPLSVRPLDVGPVLPGAIQKVDPAAVRAAIEAKLAKFKVPRIDLVMVSASSDVPTSVAVLREMKKEGKVSGRVDYRGDDHVLIDTGGVGYLVYCSDRTLAAMPTPGGAVALYTELVVREDLMQLFGFRTLAEREWHRLLVTVQGVGAKAALAILGTLGPEGVARALSLGDVSAIRAAPGVGPKLAQRVVLELRAKAPAVMAMGAAGAEPAMVSGKREALPERAPAAAPVAPMASPQLPGGDAQARADALSALVNLGYGEGEAAAAVAGVEAGDAAAMIRAALRALAPRG